MHSKSKSITFGITGFIYEWMDLINNAYTVCTLQIQIMTCKSTDFKKFQKRIRRTLNYGHGPRQGSAQISRMLNAFLNAELDFELVDKLSNQGYVSPCSMLTAMIYISRLKKTKDHEYQQFNLSELYLSSLVLSTKFLNDGNLNEFVWNDEWASASGFSLPILNKLEIQLLQALDWDVSVSEECFNSALAAVEEWVTWDLYMQNGQLTYNDLLVLSRNVGLEGVKELLLLMAKIFCTLLAFIAAISIAAHFSSMTSSTKAPDFELAIILKNISSFPSYELKIDNHPANHTVVLNPTLFRRLDTNYMAHIFTTC